MDYSPRHASRRATGSSPPPPRPLAVRRFLATAAGEGRGWSPSLPAAVMAAGPPPPLEPSPLPVFSEEGFGDKFLRKTRENPLVPLGEGAGPGGEDDGEGPGRWGLATGEGSEQRVGSSWAQTRGAALGGDMSLL